MPNFFIDRPIFSWVVAIALMLAGLISILNMPVEQYPNIAPPAISITTSYPGASPEVLENSVTQIIEQSLTGIDNLRYFSAISDAAGSVTITLTFEAGTNPDTAQVQVQNKMQSSISLLPVAVQNQGITVSKSNNNFLMVVNLYSKDGSVSAKELADLLLSDFRDQIARINGVGSINPFSTPIAMRIWLDPGKLVSYNLTATDVVSAIRAQNVDVASGQLGGLPAVPGQQLNATIIAGSRLQTIEEFENIILTTKRDGSKVLLKDVAKVELGFQDYSVSAKYLGVPSAGMAIILASGANALKTADAVKKKVAELSKNFPDGVSISYPIDSTAFIKLSIKGVVQTLFEGVLLVFIVMFLFLQNFRATLVPTIAVPVVLLGTFAILLSLGYSINTLTMFAMVLSIGLLVDDAIVVVENVERIMDEEHLSPVEATKKSMSQITGALVGIGLVLSAVFVPMAFFSGTAGSIYRQFSVTIVAAMSLSVITAIIFSPALCATLLKPANHDKKQGKFFTKFNASLSKVRGVYETTSHYIMRKTLRFLLIYGVLCAGLFFLLQRMPTSFLPNEDQGTLYFLAASPAGAAAERTNETLEKVQKYLMENEAENIEHLFTVSGFSTAGNAQNMGFGFIGMKDWSLRTRKDQSTTALAARAMAKLMSIKDAFVFFFEPPPIRELGIASGFDLQLIDSAGLGRATLMDARNNVLGLASKNPKLRGVRPNGLENVPQLKVNVDYLKAGILGIDASDVNSTLQIAWGSSYIGDFLDRNRVKNVFVQGGAEARMLPEDLGRWYVRNSDGNMVSFSNFSNYRWIYGSPRLERFNGVPSVNLQGSAAHGVSSGEAMLEMEKIMDSVLPKGITYFWSGLSYEERSSGSQVGILYAISILVVFLSLAALYESWSVPFAIILIVPFGVLGAVVFASAFGFDNDIYFQVALLTTVGLSAKNAILIVEFAKHLYEKENQNLMDAAITAIRMRFRPILMTSMAFMLGILPLALASGAGSASQNAIGISVMGGMVFSTFFATFFVPLLYKITVFKKKTI